MLKHLLILQLLISVVSSGCIVYSGLICSQSAPGFLIQNETASLACDLTCPDFAPMIAYLPDVGSQLTMSRAYWKSGKPFWNWMGCSSPEVSLGRDVQFGCLGQPRCGPFIDGTGVEHKTRCNSKDVGAQCHEDTTIPQCTCSKAYSGPTCAIEALKLLLVENFFGEGKKLQQVMQYAQKSPASFTDVLPAFMASMNKILEGGKMGFPIDELIDSFDYEMKEMDYRVAFTAITDNVLGNCYTFNYANKTNSFDGLYNVRFAGQSRAFSIILKFDPTEQLPWVESSAISTYIHAPGTPPSQGLLYSVRPDSSYSISLKKSITKLMSNCITTTSELKKNYYEIGDYTTDGCYSGCYQDKVFEKCGCMDARRGADKTKPLCQFKDTDCLDSVTAEYGDASGWKSCVCPQPCYQETYRLSSTRSSLPFKLPSCGSNTDGCLDMSDTVAHLTIYLDSLESEVYVQMERISFSTFLSQFGGLMGFLLGMSIVGILEILILCCELGKNSCSKSK